jgi:cytochrome c551/c552
LLLWVGISPCAARAAFDPAVAFESKCSGCHSVGHGVVVGPDLKGVTARHDRRWLHRFIRSSQTVVRSGDRVAVSLFDKFQKVMPDHPFSAEEIDRLLAFIEAGGPANGVTIRHAKTATAQEIAHGRSLFLGTVRLARGGAACADCHRVEGATGPGGSTLASDLTRVYAKYQDWGLTRALREADFPLMAEIYRAKPLTRSEVFALKAFLHRTAKPSPPAAKRVPFPLALLGLGGSD